MLTYYGGRVRVTGQPRQARRPSRLSPGRPRNGRRVQEGPSQGRPNRRPVPGYPRPSRGWGYPRTGPPGGPGPGAEPESPSLSHGAAGSAGLASRRARGRAGRVTESVGPGRGSVPEPEWSPDSLALIRRLRVRRSAAQRPATPDPESEPGCPWCKFASFLSRGDHCSNRLDSWTCSIFNRAIFLHTGPARLATSFLL